MSLLDLAAAGGQDVLPGQWRLARVEVVNWGTFNGFHGVDVSRKGQLVTGGSGTGKSTLLDAITAVLTPKGAVRFNAAALDAEGGGRDRNWVSYVRGAWGRQADQEEERTVAKYLRPGPTWSGILLRFENEVDPPLNLIRLFHMRGSSTNPADLKELSAITQGPQALLDFAPYAQGGIDKRRLDRELKPIISTTSRQAGYLRRMRARLGIRTENALLLLHRTQAAKNITNLDDLLRRFMLPRPDTFDRADKAVEQFGELRDAYEHVVDARLQRDALLEVTRAADDALEAGKQVGELSALARGVDDYAAGLKLRLAGAELREAEALEVEAAAGLERARHGVQVAEDSREAARERLLGLGGAELRAHEARIVDAEGEARRTGARRTRFAEQLAQVNIPFPQVEGDYAVLADTARKALQDPDPPAVSHDLQDRAATARKRAERLREELRFLEKHGSNIDPRLVEVRDRLAQALGVAPGLLPFAGELISVKPEYDDWRGAIERVLRPLATSLLVREQEIAAVRNYVEGRNLGVNLTFEAVETSPAPPPSAGFANSLVNRVSVEQGVFADALWHRLVRRFDYRCVDSPDQLGHVERGVTIAGLVKQPGQRYVKADRHPVGDQARWVLGGDIEPKQRALRQRLRVAEGEYDSATSELQAANQARDLELRRRGVYLTIDSTPWPEVDLQAAQRRVGELQQQLAALTAPHRGLAEAQQDLDRAREQVRDAAGALEDAIAAHSRAEANSADLRRLIRALENTAPVEEGVAAALEKRFHRGRRRVKSGQVDALSRDVSAALAREVSRAQDREMAATLQFTRRAQSFTTDWQALTADLTTELADQQGYRDILDAIVSQGLPEHEQSFRQLLDTRARDDAVFLRDSLLGALREINQRIMPVNEALGQSQFDRDRYLRIRVKSRRTQEVDDFLDQLKNIVTESFADETLAAAEARFQELAEVMRRLGSPERVDREWRTRVLDTRTHVSFTAEEVDEGGFPHNVYDDPAGLSGGQRQKLVAFSLAAALRYQLAEPGAAVPKFGTVIIDEAFGKSDPTYKKLTLDAFADLGFHLVLATPNTALQAFEPYVGGVTVISNEGARASRLTNAQFQ